MPRALRYPLAASSFFVFFVGAAVISWVVLPLLSLSFNAETRRRRRARMVRFSIRFFVGYMVFWRLIEVRWPALPADFPRGAYVLVANHPTLIDTTLVLAHFRGLSTVVSRKWFDRKGLGGLLRGAGFIPGPIKGSEDDGGRALEEMVATLRAGQAMIVFPEGTRSDPDRLLRFRRGAIEAAIQAGVPVVPLFIAPDRAMLLRGQPWYHFPDGKGVYQMELWPVIETAGKELDARELNRELHERYRARWERVLAERQAAAGLPGAPASAPLPAAASADEPDLRDPAG
ncbi:MAG: lysophospholipid acyltransferase family protein [Nannocystaceae bacterium]